MLVELNEESPGELYTSRDFVELTGLGHDLSETPDEDAAAANPVEANFRCRSCGDEVRFRNLAWGFTARPLWVLTEMSGGDPSEDCHARRVGRFSQRRLVWMKALERWRRLRWTAVRRRHFN